MTEALKEKSPDEARSLARTFRSAIRGNPAEELSEKLRTLASVHRFPRRVQCASLPWEALERALQSEL